MTSGVIGEVLHFQETNLIETAGEDINNVAIVGSPLGKGVVELYLS